MAYRRTQAVVRQNLLWAAGYNAVCVPLAVVGWMPPWVAGLGMACSSLFVVLNAARLARMIVSAASGEALFRRSTFLTESEGKSIASPLVTIIDDATLPAQLASKPFDGEGVRTRRNAIVEAGVFRQFLFDSYYARRTGRRTTPDWPRRSSGRWPGRRNRRRRRRCSSTWRSRRRTSVATRRRRRRS